MDQKGFTLLELLIAMALLVVVSTAGYTFFDNSLKFTVVQSSNNEMQQEIRIASDIMAREIRNAGFGVIEPLSKSLHPAAALFPTLTSGNNVSPDPDGLANQLDTIAVSAAYRVVGTLNVAGADASVSVAIDPTPGTDPTNPSIVGSTITIDGFYTDRVTAVAGPVAGVYTLTLNSALDREYAAGNTVSILEQITYQVAPNGTELALWRNDGANNAVIASGIEDLQIAYLLNDGTIVNNPVGALSPLRGVRFSLLARRANPSASATISSRPALEDHAAGASVDRFHRRRITRVIEIRNLGL